MADLRPYIPICQKKTQKQNKNQVNWGQNLINVTVTLQLHGGYIYGHLTHPEHRYNQSMNELGFCLAKSVAGITDIVLGDRGYPKVLKPDNGVFKTPSQLDVAQ